MASLAIGAGASLLSGVLGGKGAKKAAKQQAAAIEQAIGEQRRQYDQSRADFAPFLGAGQGALSEQMALLGIPMPGIISGFGGGTWNADGTQQTGTDPYAMQDAAIARLKASPGFTSLYDTGQDTILQNAAATGGLRGGDTQNSLAQFGSGLLAQVIQDRLSNLGGLSALGSGAAGSLGGLGQNNANSISSLLGQLGNANATSSAAPYAALQGLFANIGGNARSGGGIFSGVPGAKW